MGPAIWELFRLKWPKWATLISGFDFNDDLLYPLFSKLSLPGFTTVEGMHFSGQGKATFYLSSTVLDKYSESGFASKYYDAYLIPEVLKSPAVVFEGLNRENQAASLCYARIPSHRYLNIHTTVPAWPDQTFAVYMNEELKIFDWVWEISDAKKPSFPIKWETRYAKILWQA